MKERERGFTLLELSIVLALIGIILGMGLIVMTSSLQASQFNATVARMDAIETALRNFAVANDRLPCPSDLTQTSSSATYGVEAGAGSGSATGVATGVCSGTGMTPQANFVSTSGAAEGGVPTRALRLSDDYMYDGWGRRLRYAVDPVFTKSSSLPATAACSATVSADTSAITVNDATGAARTATAAYALISHGANGHGAYTSNGVPLNAGSVNADELTNCHCTSSAVAGTYTPTYVQKVPLQDSSNALDNFDDIVAFKDAWQMQALNFPLSATTCQFVYVTDTNNSRVVKYTDSGAYVATIGSHGTGNGQLGSNGPWGATVDGSGNVWVADTGNNRVQKFSSSGSFLLSIGGTSSACTSCGCTSGSCPSTAGSGNGQLNTPNSVTIDGYGNVWVSDYGNNRVVEYSSTGTWLQNIGGTAAACTSCGCTSGSCPNSNGIGNGQIGGPAQIAFDSSGNVWVADQWNSRLVEYTSTGTWLKNIGGTAAACSSCGCTGSSTCPSSYGSGNGQLHYVIGLAIDNSGNLWAADEANNRVVEYNSAGTWLQTIGGTASACTNCACTGPSTCPSSSGSGNGQIGYEAYSVALDANGNVCVADGSNNRVVEYSSTGTWLRTIGGTAAACTSCGCTGPSTCPNSYGSGNGQLSAPTSATVH